MKYGQELPKNVEADLDAYIERIKNIQWFKPSKDIKSEDIDRQVNVVLEAFGVKASIEYRSIKNSNDLDAAWGSAWGSAWGFAFDAARDAAWGSAWDSARDAARDAAWGAALDAARGSASVRSVVTKQSLYQ